MTDTPTVIADRLLDAQVAWVVAELSGERLAAVIEREVDELLAIAAEVRLADVVAADRLVAALDRLLAAVPAGPGAADVATAVADQLHDGPPAPTTPAGLADRARVAALVDALLPLRPLVRQSLDRLTEAPAAGTLASRFVTRLVVDVLEMNRSVASRIPGIGGIVSMGTNAATRMVGAADKQVQALFGDSAGKGAAMAVRRLNSVVMATLEDPMLRDAALEVWDLAADDPLEGLGDVVSRADLRRLALVVRDVVADAAASPPVNAFLAALVERLVAEHGDRTIAEVVADAGLDRDDLVVIATAVVPPVVELAVADGTVERVARARLAPFFRSPEVTTILTGATT